MCLIAAHSAIKSCFEAVNCSNCYYFTWQSVPGVGDPVEEEIFSLRVLGYFFEILKAVTSKVVSYWLETVGNFNLVNIVDKLVQLNQIASFSPVNQSR